MLERHKALREQTVRIGEAQIALKSIPAAEPLRLLGLPEMTVQPPPERRNFTQLQKPQPLTLFAAGEDAT